MNKKAIVGIFMSILMAGLVGCAGSSDAQAGDDLKPVIYLYPQEDNTEISVSLDYNGNLVDLIPEFNADKTWNVTANKDGKITFEGQTYDYTWLGQTYTIDYGDCAKGVMPAKKMFPANGSNYLMPIPRPEITKSEGSIIQNPGYN